MSAPIDLKTEELIAIGVAYAINCKFCMEYHKKKAVEAGVTREEMLSAIRIAEAVLSGTHAKTKGYAKTIFDGEVVEERCCPVGSECCP
jgi:AhpD family alkylhydroperoxidase